MPDQSEETRVGKLEVKDRVQRMLGELGGGVEIDPTGDFTFMHGSTRVFVTVEDQANNATLVHIYALVAMDLPDSPQLFKFIATQQFVLGALTAMMAKDGTFAVQFSHHLIGDTLDSEELRLALGAVANITDGLDDDICNRFGGKRWVDKMM